VHSRGSVRIALRAGTSSGFSSTALTGQSEPMNLWNQAVANQVLPGSMCAQHMRRCWFFWLRVGEGSGRRWAGRPIELRTKAPLHTFVENPRKHPPQIEQDLAVSILMQSW